MTAPTVIDLFSGCGGGSLGFKMAGFAIAGAVEVEADASASYELLTGTKPTTADIRGVTKRDIGPVRRGGTTLVFGCPPCQSFTILRRGREALPRDRIRNSLPAQYLRLVDEIRPRHLAFENVPGFADGRWKAVMARFLADLHDLGYECVFGVVDAAVYGVPQHRRRFLLVGSRVATPRLPSPTHGPGLKPFVTVRDVLDGLLELKSGESDLTDDMHFARCHSPIAIQRLRKIPEGGGRFDLPPELQLACHRDRDGYSDIYGRMSWDQPAPTLTSGCTNVTRGRFAHPEQDRAITLREAMLLQGFPPSAKLVGGIESASLQVGNAVPPPLAERIGEAILTMEAESRRRQPLRSQ